MMTVDDIRKAIIELPENELKVYLEETIWGDVEEGTSEDDEIHNRREKACDSFKYDDLKTRDGYIKLMNLMGIKSQDEAEMDILNR